MAQIKIINFEFGKEKSNTEKGLYQLNVDFEFIVSKVELMDHKNYAVQFSIGGLGTDKQKFKLAGCEMSLSVSMNDYTIDTLNLRMIDEKGRLHYLLHHECDGIKPTDAQYNKKINDIDSVFVMADLYTSENHLLLGFTGSASKMFSGVTVLK